MEQAEAERAIPLLEDVLNKNNSLRDQEARALRAGAQRAISRAPAPILLNYAKGGGNPDLQLEAIRYIAQNKDRQTTSADLPGDLPEHAGHRRQDGDHQRVPAVRQHCRRW